MHEKPMWGYKSFVNGFQIPEARTLREQAARGGIHLLNAIGLLINNGSDEALEFGEELLRTYSD